MVNGFPFQSFPLTVLELLALYIQNGASSLILHHTQTYFNLVDTHKYKCKTIKLLEENIDKHVYPTPGRIIHFLFDLNISGTIDSRFALVLVCNYVLYILGPWELVKTLRKVSQDALLLEKRNKDMESGKENEPRVIGTGGDKCDSEFQDRCR